jgi:hypothetical protein
LSLAVAVVGNPTAVVAVAVAVTWKLFLLFQLVLTALLSVLAAQALVRALALVALIQAH